jgi:3D-(3,5/4)-trihydroxycyclohexane-1,2-dione acylhydrolase (decyclizing)
MTRRLTLAQATIAFLKNQYSERDGREQRFFGGCFGIFGHGNLTGVGQALQQNPDFRYYLARNEQAMVHTACGFAKATNRLRTMVCTSSIGPGATNMITGAAAATINRLPVLLLPGDTFARRAVAPVLQQLEQPGTPDVSVNDCFRPVARYWDRIQRPEQILTSLPEAMRVLTSPSETGAVILALPQDAQTEAFDCPEEFLEKRVWHVSRPRGDRASVKLAAEWIRSSKKPLIISGGGVLYSDASTTLARFAAKTGIAVVETQAGKGALTFDHPQLLGAIGVSGTPGANILAREADLIVGIGTRYTDFTTASKTAFENEDVRFININVAEFDAFKHAALPIVADAQSALDELMSALGDYYIATEYADRVRHFHLDWDAEVERLYSLKHGPPISQSEVIGAVNRASKPRDVVVCAAGSAPGDLHKLWRTRDPKGYHVEYGFSTMGYEIAGGLGVKMACPDREVYVLVGDGSYLMLSQEIVTSLQESYRLIIVLMDNHGFASIGGLSHSSGSGGFGTEYRYRLDGALDGDPLKVDFVANAASLGAHARRVETREQLEEALVAARTQPQTSVIVVETDLSENVPSYESWWDVPIAEVSNKMPAVQAARTAYDEAKKRERYFLTPDGVRERLRVIPGERR